MLISVLLEMMQRIRKEGRTVSYTVTGMRGVA
jgi:hypothetical protein